MPCAAQIEQEQINKKKREMNIDSFMDLVASSELAEHGEYLRGIVRPSIEIVRTESAKSLGCSRLGGVPDLPSGVEWPSHVLDAEQVERTDTSRRPYRFLGQINFFEVTSSQLPTRGLLSLFVQYDPEGELEFFWQDEGFVYAHYSADIHDLSPLSPPASVDCATETSIALYSGIDIPYDEYQRKDWPFEFDKLRDSYRQLRDALHESGEYLLGYPSYFSLGYDPTPGQDWLSLLTLGSDDDWCWHDGDNLMVFIRRAQLVKKDFSALRADAG